MTSLAYLGMQCFWGESAFAKLMGVVGTRVGYAGGTTIDPTYHRIGDHSEVIEVKFKPSVLSYSSLLDYFWSHHDPTERHKKQYQSAILWTDEEQRKAAEESFEAQKKKYGKALDTYVQKLDVFYQAEDYHQKYWLRCQSAIYRKLKLSAEDTANSELAAKMNAFLAGYKEFAELERLQKEHKLDDDLVKVVKTIAENGGDPRACH